MVIMTVDKMTTETYLPGGKDVSSSEDESFRWMMSFRYLPIRGPKAPKSMLFWRKNQNEVAEVGVATPPNQEPSDSRFDQSSTPIHCRDTEDVGRR